MCGGGEGGGIKWMSGFAGLVPLGCYAYALSLGYVLSLSLLTGLPSLPAVALLFLLGLRRGACRLYYRLRRVGTGRPYP